MILCRLPALYIGMIIAYLKIQMNSRDRHLKYLLYVATHYRYFFQFFLINVKWNILINKCSVVNCRSGYEPKKGKVEEVGNFLFLLMLN